MPTTPDNSDAVNLATADLFRAEIARLQAENERLRSQPCPYVTGKVTRYCTLTPLTPLTLTDGERQAVEDAIGWIASPSVEDEATPEDYLPITATLRGLLDRTDTGGK